MGTQPPELEDSEQNEDPIIQGEKFRNLICILDTLKPMEVDRIHTRVLRELAEVLTKSLPVFIRSPV